MAEFITTTGREINVALQNWSKEKGFTPIYGDTDSIFIAGVDSVSVGRELQSYYNEKLSAWASEKGSVIDPTIKFEKQYRRILFKKKSTSDGEAKKRYAGHIVWKDGFEVDKLDYTGIELKRSDQSKFTKDVLEEFLKDLLLKDNPQDAIQVIRDAIRRVKNGEVSIFDVSVPKGIKDLDSDNPWCRGVRNTERILGRPFPVGFKPRVVYTKGDIREVCIAEDISEEEIREKVVVDWTTIQNKVVEKKLKSFVESIGMDWADVIHGQKGFEEWV
jgi:DNA polymerase I